MSDSAEPDLATRIQELEIRYMRLERFTEELSDVVAAQQQTIDQLNALTARLRQQMWNAGDVKNTNVDEPPPHY